MTSELIMPLVFLGLVAIPPMIILLPLSRLARCGQKRVRFAIVDVLALVLLLQIVLGLFSYAADEFETVQRVMMALLGCLISGSMWLSGVTLLSRIGVHRSRTRFFFLAYAMPAAVVGPLCLLMSLIAVLQSMWGSRALFVFAAALAATTHAAIYVRRLAKEFGDADPER